MDTKKIEILIVEDSLTQAEGLKYILEEHDYLVSHAINGQKALEMLAEAQPDIIISDIVMPDMDGYQFCLTVKADDRLKKIPVILLTSLSDPSDVMKGLESGADSFLVKPYNEALLITRIQYFVQNSELRKTQVGNSGLEVLFSNLQYTINSSRQQILDILLSTYETYIFKNHELIESNRSLKISQEKLTHLNTNLEQQVKERTRELEASHKKVLVEMEDRIQAEEVLRQSEMRYHSLFTEMLEGFALHEIICDEEGNPIDYRFLDLNPAFERLVGLKADDIRGKRVLEVLPLTENFWIETYGKVALTGQPAQFENYSQSLGKYFHVGAFSPMKNQFATFFTDITERKIAEIELTESNELNKSLIQTIPFGIDIIDELGNILFMSDNFINLFGSEAIGKKCWEIYRDDKKQCADCPLVAGINIGETALYETRGVLGGKTFQISHTGLLFKGKKAILEIFQDITDRKLGEVELIKAKEHAEESDRLKSSFLANMSHEVRTPLNAIIGFSELLLDPDFETDQKQEFGQLIINNGNDLLSIISNIMDISKIESGEVHFRKAALSVNKLMNSIQKEYSIKTVQKGIKLRFDSSYPDEEIMIQSDGERIRQILIYLVDNAIKFTENGYIELGIKKTGTFVQFHIKDTGIGIPIEFHEQIFERFRQIETAFTRKYGGNGLGLTISKNLIELLGGKIWVESEQGKGSTFYFTLPINVYD